MSEYIDNKYVQSAQKSLTNDKSVQCVYDKTISYSLDIDFAICVSAISMLATFMLIISCLWENILFVIQNSNLKLMANLHIIYYAIVFYCNWYCLEWLFVY